MSTQSGKNSIPMKLFEGTRQGNDADGPAISYLIYARDHEEAATLLRRREPTYDVKLDFIAELGVSNAEFDEPVVARGPYPEHKLEHDSRFTFWSRDASQLEAWVPTRLEQKPSQSAQDKMPMKLFEVSRWGNDFDGDGGNGPDTDYLVCARDHEEAAALALERDPHVGYIIEFALCTGEVEGPLVLRGPYIAHAFRRGYVTSWWWNDKLNAWEPGPICRDGEATCYYPNGQIAARRLCREGRQSGESLLWYPNGQMMHRGTYLLGGRRAGIHEYWYEDGTQASRYEYVKRGVKYKEWDRSGQLISDEVESW